MKLISKSRFLAYQMCPKDAWFRLHTPDLEEFEVSFSSQQIMNLGNDVEDYAKKLFSGMVEVETWGYKAKKEVDALMEKKVPAMYQPTFVANGFIIRCDILAFNKKTKKWDLYEVKATNSMKEDGPRDHISDLTFQTIILEASGVDLGSTYIVHLNKEYVLKGDIDIKKLFVITDATEEVKSAKEETRKEMEKCKKYLNQEKEPKEGCDCHYYGRNSHCDTFEKSHPEIPEYSVHDLSRISNKKLIKLVEDGIYHIHDIEDISDFSEIQQNQILAHKTGEVIEDLKEIKVILDSYKYPLYFFDYETFAPAVPVFDGYSSYKKIPIQFSLHIMDKKEGPLRHIEYLHIEKSDPSEAIAKLLCESIDPNGTVLAWNFSFEKGVTKEIGNRSPQYKKILNRICRQMKDLRDIFTKQHYVHKDFRGKAGVGDVMEVLTPHLNYDDIPYTGLDVGFVWWNQILNGNITEKERKVYIKNLLDYCCQDTFVMVEIWRKLIKIVKI